MITRQITEEVKKIILKHSAPERIYLFGSRENGEASRGSDIDIAFDDPNLKDMSVIEDEIDRLGTLVRIDVKNLAHCGERFRNRVIQTGRVIYSSTKMLRAADGLYNYKNALEKFSRALEMEDQLKLEGFGDIYPDLAVKRFEFTFETAWKAVKRYLDYLGFDCRSPRACIKEAYAQGILNREDIWLTMIEQRNLSSHIYSENEIKEITAGFPQFRDSFIELAECLSEHIKIED